MELKLFVCCQKVVSDTFRGVACTVRLTYFLITLRNICQVEFLPVFAVWEELSFADFLLEPHGSSLYLGTLPSRDLWKKFPGGNCFWVDCWYLCLWSWMFCTLWTQTSFRARQSEKYNCAMLIWWLQGYVVLTFLINAVLFLLMKGKTWEVYYLGQRSFIWLQFTLSNTQEWPPGQQMMWVILNSFCIYHLSMWLLILQMQRVHLVLKGLHICRKADDT